MARPQKYKEPTVMFSKRVPKSKVYEVGKLVSDFLDNIKPKENIDSVIQNDCVIQNESPKTIGFRCGCIFDGTLLRKQKNSPCRLTKAEHEALK